MSTTPFWFRWFGKYHVMQKRTCHLSPVHSMTIYYPATSMKQTSQESIGLNLRIFTFPTPDARSDQQHQHQLSARVLNSAAYFAEPLNDLVFEYTPLRLFPLRPIHASHSLTPPQTHPHPSPPIAPPANLNLNPPSSYPTSTPLHQSPAIFTTRLLNGCSASPTGHATSTAATFSLWLWSELGHEELRSSRMSRRMG